MTPDPLRVAIAITVCTAATCVFIIIKILDSIAYAVATAPSFCSATTTAIPNTIIDASRVILIIIGFGFIGVALWFLRSFVSD